MLKTNYHWRIVTYNVSGYNDHETLIQQRVERAKQLLNQTDHVIADIALDCGFNSHSHLSKQFRKLTGMTPKAYRSN